MAHISEITKDAQFMTLKDEEKKKVINGWVEENVMQSQDFLSLDEDARAKVVNGYVDDYYPNKEPWYKKTIALPEWIDTERWNGAVTDLETSITQFVKPEQYAKPAPGIISKYAKVATNPLTIAEGAASFVTRLPGFLGGFVGAAQQLSKRVLGGDFDLNDYYEEAAAGFTDSAEYIDKFLAYNPRGEGAELVGETVTALPSAVMLVGQELAESDAVNSLPPEWRNQVKGLLKFAGDIGGIVIGGKAGKKMKVGEKVRNGLEVLKETGEPTLAPDLSKIDVAKLKKDILEKVSKEVEASKPAAAKEVLPERRQVAVAPGQEGFVERRKPGSDWLQKDFPGDRRTGEMRRTADVPPQEAGRIIPELKVTEDAINFGKTASPVQVAELKNLHSQNRAIIEKQLAEGDFKSLEQLTFKNQLYREAIESSSQKNKLKETTKTTEPIIEPQKKAAPEKTAGIEIEKFDAEQKNMYDKIERDVIKIQEAAYNSNKSLKQHLTDAGIDPLVITAIDQNYSRIVASAAKQAGVVNKNNFVLGKLSSQSIASIRQQIHRPIKRRRGMVSVPSQKGAIQDIALEYMRERRAGLDISTWENNKFVNKLQKELNPTELEALSFVIEKTNVPRSLKRPDLEKAMIDSAVKLTTAAPKIDKRFQKSWIDMKKSLPKASLVEVQDYITHIWDIPKNKLPMVSDWFITQNKFLNKRFISTIKEGVELYGLKPKVLNAAELLTIHDGITYKAIENAKFVKRLNKLEQGGVRLVQAAGKAPDGWVVYDHPALAKNLYVPAKQTTGIQATLRKVPVKVHPDLVKPLNAIFQSRHNGTIINAYETINGILKKTKLSLSLFHHNALMETGIATMGIKKSGGVAFNPVKIYKAMMKNEFDVYKREPIARDALTNNLKIGAPLDIPVNKIQRQLNDFAYKTKNIPVAGSATKLLAKTNEAWDKALWPYLHDTLKLTAYESLTSKLDPMRDLIKQKREAAQMVNDTFGGQNWELMMLSPRTMQYLSWSLLSPDWTISTTRQALAPLGIGSLYKETKGMRMKMGGKFWLKAGLYYGVGVNMLNAVNRIFDKKENPQFYRGDDDLSFIDYTMIGNTTGNKTYLFAGRYPDGTERHIRFGKQFRELMELFVDDAGFSPVTATTKKIGGKLAPNVQIASKVFTGVSPSGFKDDDIYGKKGWDKTAGIALSLTKEVIPFSIRNAFAENSDFKWYDLAFPSSRGMSRYKSIELFKKAIMSDDDRLLSETYQETLRNNIPPYTMFKYALTSLKAESTRELTMGIKNIEDAKRKLKETTDGVEKKKIARRLKNLQQEKIDFENAEKLFQRALIQAERY